MRYVKAIHIWILIISGSVFWGKENWHNLQRKGKGEIRYSEYIWGSDWVWITLSSYRGTCFELPNSEVSSEFHRWNPPLGNSQKLNLRRTERERKEFKTRKRKSRKRDTGTDRRRSACTDVCPSPAPGPRSSWRWRRRISTGPWTSSTSGRCSPSGLRTSWRWEPSPTWSGRCSHISLDKIHTFNHYLLEHTNNK